MKVSSFLIWVLKKGISLGLFLFFSLAVSAQNLYMMEKQQMGTLFKVKVYADDSSKVAFVSSWAFMKLDSLNMALSDYREDSEINKLCRTAGDGKFHAVSDDLWQILLSSREAALLSSHVFDVTIGPLSQLWRRMKRQKILPSATQISDAKQKVGFEKILFSDSEKAIKLLTKGMRIDFGGIGKGYAEDEMLKIFRKNGFSQVMIEAGGNIVVGDAPPNAKGWEIEIFKKKKYFTNCGISTSGDVFQWVEINGIRYAHILDPSTGLGALYSRQVSVIAKDGTTSDWLSTTAFLSKKQFIRRLSRSLKAKCYFSW